MGGAASGTAATLLRLATLAAVQARALASEGEHVNLFPPPGPVINVAPSTFNKTVLADSHTWAVLMYADWCEDCVRYASEFLSIANDLGTDTHFRSGALNCAEHYAFCDKMNVRTYPSIRVFHVPALSSSWTELGAAVLRETHASPTFQNWIRSQMVTLTPPAAQKDLAQGKAASAAPAAWDHVLQRYSATPSEMRRFDLEAVLLYSFRQGVPLALDFRQDGGMKRKVLMGEALTELLKWFRFLASAYPTPKGRQKFADLHRTVSAAVTDEGGDARFLDFTRWKAIYSTFSIELLSADVGEDPENAWTLCSGYTCGLWTLFHTATLVAAEAHSRSRGFLAGSHGLEDVPSPGEALQRVRGFVAHFFGCSECVTNFIEFFDSCGLGRCDLADGDGPGAVLWLWQVHNQVTARLARERGESSPKPWPSIGECTDCWLEPDQSKWSPTRVYAHLRWTYLGKGASVAAATTGLPDEVFACIALTVLAVVYLVWRSRLGKLRDAARYKGS